MANATSTVALVPAALAAVWGYRRELVAVRRWALLLAVPSLLGGLHRLAAGDRLARVVQDGCPLADSDAPRCCLPCNRWSLG